MINMIFEMYNKFSFFLNESIEKIYDCIALVTVL